MNSDEDELCPPPGSEEEELSLPRASINKMIKEMVKYFFPKQFVLQLISLS